jgi:hypothetical protein
MKTKTTYNSSSILIIVCLCIMVAGISLSTSALAQAEPCSVEVTSTCTGSTDCSGSLSGGMEIKNTGTTVITCQVVADPPCSGTGETGGCFGGFGETVLLSPGQSTMLFGFAYIPIGCGFSHEFSDSGWAEAHCQVGCNPDATCEDYDEWQCSVTCEGTVPTDIKPGSCPNTISLRDKGSLPVAIMGDADLDLTKVDTASIRLSREGVAGTVAPTSWNFKEIGSPFAVELCDCIRSKRDVYNDLVFNFDVQQVINVLGLGDALDQMRPLTMTGRMTEECNGRTYIKSITGKGCVLIQR